MNLLAFLAILWCAFSLAAFAMFPDEVEDILKAIAERIRNPRPSAMQELHRHWEVMDGKRDPE